jgi:hypothetical protein
MSESTGKKLRQWDYLRFIPRRTRRAKLNSNGGTIDYPEKAEKAFETLYVKFRTKKNEGIPAG